MPVVRAGPNQYLLVGRRGTLQNRGSAVQAFLLPGTIHVLVPGTKQEATFEFTQETNDGIPLRFKGIVIYRIADPVAAARQFDLGAPEGLRQVTTLVAHVCLGELRDAVSHMSMVECIEQRKTTLSGVVAAALERAIHGDGDGTHDWGIDVEVAQVAQVFIVDQELRQQLEAEVRNDIQLRSDQSGIRTREQTSLAELQSDGRVQEQTLAADKEALRRDQERMQARVEFDRQRVDAETPLRLLTIAKDSEVAREGLALERLRTDARALEVERDLLLERARQELRREILPIEQTPQIVAAASRVLQGANLSIYGDNAQLLGQLAPVLELLTRALRRATDGRPDAAPAPAPDGAS